MKMKFQPVPRTSLREIKGGGTARLAIVCRGTCVRFCLSTPEIFCECVNGNCMQSEWPGGGPN
ncbi:hypothetical protein KTO58_14540 [Chitinophaga pendula]|uniref:hypothetical protein n=1 Tax=Chitinophaga TaxID=79328 RepID=UPI0012FE54D4|nr:MULTISPECIES: hypothetical protein [Chitinophaga]UCJ04919.1 hypothetical protein KTO58_14540 [Chitinophaga pendula]